MSKSYKKVCYSLEETAQLAKKFAKATKDGCFVNLFGEIGAGKTAFVRLVAQALEIKEKVTSPSFTILNEYHTGEIPIYHFDLYRLSDADEFYAMGGEEYLNNGICIFEWGDMIEDQLSKYTKITFSRLPDNDDPRCFPGLMP